MFDEIRGNRTDAEEENVVFDGIRGNRTDVFPFYVFFFWLCLHSLLLVSPPLLFPPLFPSCSPLLALLSSPSLPPFPFFLETVWRQFRAGAVRGPLA